MLHTPCIICHEHNQKIHKLRQIRDFLKRQDLKPVHEKKISYYWDIQQHCRFGIDGCDKLSQFEHENWSMINEIEPMLNAFVKEADKGEKRQLLELLRGDFAMLYRQIETMI